MTTTTNLRIGSVILSCIFLISGESKVYAARQLDLSGTWRYELDRDDAGVEGKWFSRPLAGKLKLPGSLPAQGIGDDVSLDTKWIGGIQQREWFKRPLYAAHTNVGDFKFPFWLQPEKHYVGAAWYQREFDLPESWVGKRVVLTLERPHWQTQVWLDGKDLGTNRSLSTSHQYDLGSDLSSGKHTLTLCVDNRMIIDIGENSHAVSDHTQGNWNGIVGKIFLSASDAVWIEDVQIYPSLRSQSVVVRGQIGNATDGTGSGKLGLKINSAGGRAVAQTNMNAQWTSGGGAFAVELPVPNPKPWDEFQPNLYSLIVTLNDAETKRLSFGFRDVSTEGTQIAINGRRLFLRGTLECCIFPLTGHPPTDVDSWKKVIRAARAHGLNHIRFHSYCPPEAAFVAADELGFYYQVETCWPNQTTSLGDGKPVDAWVHEETERILKAYGNHPSFLLMAHGNEPGGKRANAFLSQYVAHYKAIDSRRLWTSGAGWPQLAENQFHVTPDPRIQAWGEGLKSRINSKPPETLTDYRDYVQQRGVPVISHEIGQWCVYPNFEEIPKYKGYLKPRNFEIFRESLEAKGMLHQARDFLFASGKLQALCYKEDIESALRTPGMAGFQLLDLHDFPGQGTALVGVLDPFWEFKGYITAREFSRFCGQSVALARMARRVFTTNEQLEAGLEVAHFGPAPLKGASVYWKVVGDKGKIFASGTIANRAIDTGKITALEKISVPLAELPSPARYQLVAGIEKTKVENDWDFWVYPEQLSSDSDDGVTLASEMDDQTTAKLNEGEKVLLLVPPARVKGDNLGKVEIGFSSIFWNTEWTGRQAPHTLGILCDPKHAAFGSFPTEYHSNWQWWYLVSRSGAMILDSLPAEVAPVVQVIDDWVTNRKLALMFEAKVGRGKILVCSIDLETDLERNIVARQMRHSVIKYMSSSKFRPSASLTPDQVQSLVNK